MILTVPSEIKFNFGLETPRPKSRVTVWMHKIFCPNELAYVQLSGFEI